MTLQSVSKIITTSTLLLAVVAPEVSGATSPGRFAVVRQRRERQFFGATVDSLERNVLVRSAQNAVVTDPQQEQQEQEDQSSNFYNHCYDNPHHDRHNADAAATATAAVTTTRDEDGIGRFAMEYEPERTTIRSAQNAHIQLRRQHEQEPSSSSSNDDRTILGAHNYKAKPAVSSFWNNNHRGNNDDKKEGTEDESRQRQRQRPYASPAYRINDLVFS